MLNYSGYYDKSDDDNTSEGAELFVNSCGHYKLIHVQKMQTIRTSGRRDYQILYAAEGTVHVMTKQGFSDIGKGGVFIYKPNVPQNYYYVLPEKPDVYWIHFTGAKVEQILENLGLSGDEPMQLQYKEEIAELFDKIIGELRMGRYLNAEMAEVYCKQLLIQISRSYQQKDMAKQRYNSLLDEVINHFNREYQADINIAEYATKLHISCSWFIREFKKYTGYSPKQYLTNLRIQHAKELLNNRYLSINDVSSIVGYDNQLYFSRIFRKSTGMSPSEYRDK